MAKLAEAPFPSIGDRSCDRAWLLGAQAVSASLALIFVPSAAIPGATVEAHTGGESALTDVRGPATLPVYLAPIDIADRISTSKDQRLIPLGNLSVDITPMGT
jgi:hypothetical protein